MVPASQLGFAPGEVTVPLQPPKKGMKATVHKVFILDAQGGYAGEYTPDEHCVVEFGEFLAVVPDAGLADGQSLFLGEWKATTIHGERMSLVAISRGQLGPEEVSWAKAALVAAEAHLTAPPDEDAPPPVVAGPDKAVMESLARAMTQREEQLASRESILKQMEEQTKVAVEEFRNEMEGQVADLKAQLEATRAQHEVDVKALAAEREALRQQLDAIAKAPKPAEVPPPAAPTVATPAVDPKIEAQRKQNEADRKYLQKYALDLIAREEAVQDREGKVEEDTAKLGAMREELEELRAEIEAAKTAPPPEDWEAQKRELEQRVKILQEKALDILAKEEKLREKEQKLRDLMKQISA